jgi:uncharacterized protein
VGRLLVLAAIAAVIYWFVTACRRRPSDSSEGHGAEDTVRCAYCGVYLPKSEGVLANGRYFCGKAHRSKFTDTIHRE